MTTYKKIQTRVKAPGQPASASGEPSVLELGWVDGTRLFDDIERERQRFSHEALSSGGRAISAVRTVEVMDQTVVVIYESGSVCVINYIPEGT